MGKVINPDFKGNSSLILRLFGKGIERDGSLHRNLIGRARVYPGLRSYARDVVQDFYLDFSRRTGATKNYFRFELDEDLDVNSHRMFRALVDRSFKRYLIDYGRKLFVRNQKERYVRSQNSPDYKEPALEINDPNHPEGHVIDKEHLEELRQRKRDIETAREYLPFKYQEVIKLHYDEGLKFIQIAERLGIPLGTVKSRCYLAKQMLRKRLRPAA